MEFNGNEVESFSFELVNKTFVDLIKQYRANKRKDSPKDVPMDMIFKVVFKDKTEAVITGKLSKLQIYDNGNN